MASRSIAAASSSASSSTSTSSRCYDVFINHRGPDVKDTFASHLYRRLLGQGLQVFLDREELEEAHGISSQIEAAIRVASVQIAIFSPTYAESYWCLKELVLMVNSGATILPIFYHVEPSMLRRAIGPYGEALHNLQQKTTRDPLTGEEKPRYDSNTVQSWRNALFHVAGMSGFVLHGDEGELLEKVVQGVLNKVPKTPLDVAKHPTGLGEKLQEFERTVKESKTVGAKVAGIVGLGGIGKTTLAKAFFNLRRPDYDASSFLFEVRENARTMSLPYLQSKLIQELKRTDIKINSRDQGIGELKKHLSSCHALIILDDVDHIDQMEAFLPIKDILSHESLILVTSRDKHVLRSSGVLDSSIYNLKGLNRSDSEELFCCYAFHQRHPQPGFADLVDRFIMACDGLPLSLKILGALVYGQEESYWQGQLDQLPTQIQERLRISYESLDKDDQQIFLDIVCFFLRQELDTATKIWGKVGIQNLEDKCLLDVDSENCIKVHDHIRDMGRCIAKEGSMPRRLYDQSTNNIVDPSVITEVRGISMLNCSWTSDLPYYHLFNLHSQMSWYKRWTHMWKLSNIDRYHGTNLKFLVMDGGYLRSILGRVKSPHLIWLRWCNCPYSSLPSWVPIKNLRVLEVSGKRLKMLWQSETQAPLELRQLSIVAPLSHFPKSIGKLQHLEKIVVDCPAWLGSSLKTLPEEFCNLFSLKYLVLNRCSSMRSLPQSFGKLINLQHFDLSWAENLKSLPESFGELANLQRIDLSYAESLKSLPESFGRLSNLQYIDLSYAKSLQTLPDSFGELRNLQHLGLSGAFCLKTLPNSFGNLSRLKHLDLSKCHDLIMSSGALGNITTLEYLNLSDCKNVKELLPQVARQPSLQELGLRGTGLKELPSGLGNLSNLEALRLGSDWSEELPPWLVYLERLKELRLSGCPKLKWLPESFGLLTQLTELSINYHAYPPSPVKNLEKRLIVRNCPLLELRLIGELRLVGTFGRLKQLRLSWLNLEELPSLETLISLEELYVWHCPKLKSIKGLAQLTRLQRIEVVGCDEVRELAGVEHAMSLQWLDVRSCRKLKSIKGLAQLTRLQRLCVRHCDELRELAGVEHAMSLKRLEVSGCGKVQWDDAVVEQLRQRLKEGFLCIDRKQLCGLYNAKVRAGR